MAFRPTIMSSFNNIDPFERFVKNKLSDYKAEVPHSSWEKLESSLYATHKTKVIHRKRLVTSAFAAAASLIGILFILHTINRETPLQVAEYPTIKTESSTENFKEPTTKEKENKIQVYTQKLIAGNTSTIHQNASSSYTRVIQKEEIPSISSSNKEENQTEDKLFEEKNETLIIDEETKRQMIEDFINEGKRPLSSSVETNKSKSKSRKSISLTGQSGLSSSQNTNTVPTTLRSSLSDTYGTYTIGKMAAFNEQKEIKPESEINHSQPVSFGILTSFALTKKLQLETGLIYTYLTSETKSKSIDYSESEKVQFHYLGVPLNLNYTLLSINKLDMYVTVGTMIEKDVYGRLKYNDEKKMISLNSGYASNRSSKIKQNNPQFSISSGLGITYPIYDKAKLFGKIGGRYYLNANNEYKTYYSDEKFGLDIQMGIKFNF